MPFRRAIAAVGVVATVLAVSTPGSGLALGSAFAVQGGGGPTAAACGSAWAVVSSPNGKSVNILLGVSGDSTKDVWAVGETGVGAAKTLTEHWNGTKRAKVPSPSVSGTHSALLGVAAVNPKDAWAVGHVLAANHDDAVLILHWDGLHWKIFPAPNLHSPFAFLLAVAAVSKTDVWAVGTRENPKTHLNQPLVLHFTGGTSWARVKVPTTSTSTSLSGISASGPNNVWAVGSASGTFAEHFNGTWKIVKPLSKTTADTLKSVVALGTSGAFAVGTTGAALAPKTLAETFSGHWKIVPTVSPGSLSGLNGIASVGGFNVWAVGFTSPGDQTSRTLAEHGNATQFVLRATQNPSPSDSLQAVTAVGTSPHQLWAVGQQASGQVTKTLIERACV